jgi:hypothetical protein
VTGTAGWRVFSTADGFEYSKDFEGSIRGGTEQYDAPIFGITCYHNAAYVRIDTRLRAVGTKAVRVTFNGDAADWVRAEGQNIFAPNSARLLNSLSGLPRAQAQLSFAEAPPQTFTLNLNGIDKILDALHRTCALPR